MQRIGPAATCGTRDIASLPGPRSLPAVSSIRGVGEHRAHLVLERWACRYGPIYKVKLGARTVVVIADHEATTKALRERPHDFRRRTCVASMMAELGLAGLFSAEGDAWRRQRALVLRALDPAHLARFFPTLVTATERLHRHWLPMAAAGLPIDVRGDLARYTIDVTCSLAFGMDVATLGTDEVDPLQVHLDRIFGRLGRRLFAPRPLSRWFKARQDRELERSCEVVRIAVQGFVAQTRAHLDAHPQLKTEPRNLLQALVAANEDVSLCESELLGNVSTLLLAGEDTTASTLCWALHFLSLHPQSQDSMRREIAPVIGTDVAIGQYEAIGRLSVTDAVVLETLRLKPVAPLLGLTPLRDAKVAGVALPTGTEVIALTRPPATDARYFDRPDEFRPSRWLPNDEHAVDAITRCVPIPFGSGPRVCPGRNLAMLEAKMALATVVHAFDIEPTSGQVAEELGFTMHPQQLVLRLRPRINRASPASPAPAARVGIARSAAAGAQALKAGHCAYRPTDV